MKYQFCFRFLPPGPTNNTTKLHPMIWDGGLVVALLSENNLWWGMLDTKTIVTVSTCAWFREAVIRSGLCTMCDQSLSVFCLGNPVACDRHVVIGWTLAWSMGAVQSCLCSLSHIHVARDLPATPWESLQWTIQVNFCSAYQSRDPDAAMPIGICESWPLIWILTRIFVPSTQCWWCVLFWQWQYVELQVENVLGNVSFVFASRQGTSPVPVGMDDITITEGLCAMTSGKIFFNPWSLRLDEKMEVTGSNTWWRSAMIHGAKYTVICHKTSWWSHLESLGNIMLNFRKLCI